MSEPHFTRVVLAEDRIAFAIYSEWIRSGRGSVTPDDLKQDPGDPQQTPKWPDKNTPWALKNACMRRWNLASEKTRQEFRALAQAAEKEIGAAA